MKVTVGPTSNVTFQAATDRGGNPAQITLTTNNSSKVTLSQAAIPGIIRDAYAQANAAYAEANLKLNIAGGNITGSLNIAGNLIGNVSSFNSVNVSGNVYISKDLRVNGNIAFINATNSVVAYTYYNSSSNSIDTVFV